MGDDESEYDEGRQDDEEDELAEIDRLGKEDENFSRVRTILDALLETGRAALKTKAEDFAPAHGAAKVLHEEEARTWRDGGSHPRISLGHDGDETFDETFVTAESGDESGSLAPEMSSSNTARNLDITARSPSHVQVIIDDADSS